MWNPDIEFWNNITPLNRTNMMKLVENLDFLYSHIANLITNSEGEVETPLPTASGDGIIRYVVTVTKDMIWTSSSLPSGTDLIEGGRYFIAILENEQTYKYHLEIWYYTDGDWWTNPDYDETDITNVYTERCWDRCTHDKLYTCQNTNKCYYMNNSLGTATLGRPLEPGTTNQARSFMTETAEAARTIFNGAGTQSIDGWAGYARSNLLRYKVIIANFTIPEYSETAGSGPLLTVAFNPWYVINKVTFAPFVKPYGTWDGDNLTSIATGTLRIKDDLDSGKFYFDAFIGTAKLRPYIHELVGVADISI